MSSIPDTLRRIAEQIATLEAEKARLQRELVAMSAQLSREDAKQLVVYRPHAFEDLPLL